VFAALIPKLFGAKIILDLHDPMPEVFITKFGLSEKDFLLKSVIAQEKYSFKFANKVITTNKAFVDTFETRGNDAKKITIVMNSPQENVFNAEPFLRKEEDKNKFIIMYHGTIVERHGLDDAIKAISRLKETIPEIEFWIFGNGEFLMQLLGEINDADLSMYIKYKGSLLVDDIARTIPMIDIGIIPNKLTPFTNLNFPVRIFEFLYYKKPVIVPRTRGIKDYLNEDEIFYFEGGDSDSLSEVILKIYSNPVKTKEIISRAYGVYKKYNWEIQSKVLINFYKEILN
jgi:glycosyltransferase involved in cell wall biosynthesis